VIRSGLGDLDLAHLSAGSTCLAQYSSSPPAAPPRFARRSRLPSARVRRPRCANVALRSSAVGETSILSASAPLGTAGWFLKSREGLVRRLKITRFTTTPGPLLRHGAAVPARARRQPAMSDMAARDAGRGEARGTLFLSFDFLSTLSGFADLGVAPPCPCSHMRLAALAVLLAPPSRTQPDRRSAPCIGRSA